MDFENLYYTCKDNPEKCDRKIGKFVSKSYKTEGVSDIAHAVKSDNPDLLKKHIAINKIANYIIDQNILTSKDYIVPAPQHTGRAEYTLDIAKIISRETGCKIADVLGCKPRDTLFNLKKKNGAKSIEDSGLYLLTDKFPKYNVWFLDNVTATGKTFDDARKLIPHLKPLIYSISPRLKVKMKNRKPYFVRENASNGFLACCYDPEDYYEETNYVDKDGELHCNSSGCEVFATEKEAEEWADDNRPYGWVSFAMPAGCGPSLKESRTYFGDEIKEVVDWFIESPYNNWQEKDREYLMNCDNEKLFKYESDTFDLELAERSLYESNNNRGKNMKFKEGPSPKWKQKILDDINEILDIVYSVINDENGEWKEPEKYLSFSVNKFIELIKTLIDTEKYSENLLKYVAIDLWIELHCDDSVGDFNDGPETKLKYAKYLNLRKELWNPICDEYQAKYGRKRKPQPYIKDPTDASEIFNKISALKYESKKITQKRIMESFERVLNEHSHIIGQSKYVIKGTFEHNGEKYSLYYGEGGRGYDSFPTWQPYLSTAIKFKEFPNKEVIKDIVSETDKNDDDNTLTSLKVFNLRQGGMYTQLIDSETVFER